MSTYAKHAATLRSHLWFRAVVATFTGAVAAGATAAIAAFTPLPLVAAPVAGATLACLYLFSARPGANDPFAGPEMSRAARRATQREGIDLELDVSSLTTSMVLMDEIQPLKAAAVAPMLVKLGFKPAGHNDADYALFEQRKTGMPMICGRTSLDFADAQNDGLLAAADAWARKNKTGVLLICNGGPMSHQEIDGRVTLVSMAALRNLAR